MKCSVFSQEYYLLVYPLAFLQVYIESIPGRGSESGEEKSLD